MAIQTLNNGATLLEQRTKINENFSDLDTRASAAQSTATAAATAAAGKYAKPTAGIPASDLDAAVQASLANADSAVQPADLSAGLGTRAPAGSGASGAVTKADVGLGNVDNTSDVNKPVSTAQAAALAAKAPAGTGTGGAITPADIQGSTSAGRTILTAADEAAQRAALGLGSAAQQSAGGRRQDIGHHGPDAR